MEFTLFIFIGLVAGWLAGQLVAGGGFGVIGDVIVGVLGAVIGGSLFQRLGDNTIDGIPGAILVATIGAIVLIFILRIVRRVSY